MYPLHAATQADADLELARVDLAHREQRHRDNIVRAFDIAVNAQIAFKTFEASRTEADFDALRTAFENLTHFLINGRKPKPESRKPKTT